MNKNEKRYQMPPEWEEHERTFIAWPVQESMVDPKDYDKVSSGYADFVRAIAEFEPVTVVVNAGEEAAIHHRFEHATSYPVSILSIAHNDAWLRDNGPTFVRDHEGGLAGVNWRFNAWGEKYSHWTLDDNVAPQLLDHYGVPRIDAPLVMEGGSFHVDGEGTLLTTEECLLNPNRNPKMTREDIEDQLKGYLGVTSIIWLKRGLSGDETDGHVDNVACFAAPGKVLMQVCDDPQDENYEITQENLHILSEAVDACGRRLEVIPIQQPPMRMIGDQRLTLSYLNFYFVNGGIILPVFGGDAQQTDRLAQEVLGEVFPQRRIRTVNGMAIIKEGGNVHCTTQQMPLARGKH